MCWQRCMLSDLIVVYSFLFPLPLCLYLFGWLFAFFPISFFLLNLSHFNFNLHLHVHVSPFPTYLFFFILSNISLRVTLLSLPFSYLFPPFISFPLFLSFPFVLPRVSFCLLLLLFLEIFLSLFPPIFALLSLLFSSHLFHPDLFRPYIFFSLILPFQLLHFSFLSFYPFLHNDFYSLSPLPFLPRLLNLFLNSSYPFLVFVPFCFHFELYVIRLVHYPLYNTFLIIPF